MAGIFPGCGFEEFEDCYVQSHPLPTEFLNEVHLTAKPSNPDRVVEQALGYFERRSPRWRLVSPPEWQSLMVQPCRRAGLEWSQDMPEMILRIKERQATAVESDCRRVEDMSALKTFQKTFSRANLAPESGFWESKSLLDAPGYDLFVGYLDAKPVATGLGFTFNEITGIRAIATLPECRGRGMGTAITWAVVNAGRDRGARASHLWATEMGFPVYQNMGFRHVENKSIWIYPRYPE